MSDRDGVGRFAPGNRFWEARSSHGAKPKFSNPEDLWEACREYFEWNADNPLQEQKLVSFQGVTSKESVSKMRAMTINALCLFIDVTHDTWIQWRKKRPDLSEVITRAEAIIFQQKFEGASADMLNPNIIARDLGLADKKELTSPDGSMTPKPAVSLTNLSDEELEQLECLTDKARDTA